MDLSTSNTLFLYRIDTMKVLAINSLLFMLPSDFDGSVSDALRLAADYHDMKHGTSRNVATGRLKTKTFEEAHNELWDHFITGLAKNNHLSTIWKISEYVPEKNEWVTTSPIVYVQGPLE